MFVGGLCGNRVGASHHGHDSDLDLNFEFATRFLLFFRCVYTVLATLFQLNYCSWQGLLISVPHVLQHERAFSEPHMFPNPF
jgi:hypothetical protein